LTRGAAHAGLGEYDRALADYSKAAEIRPGDWRVFLQRSPVHAKAGSADKAAADWALARKLNQALTDDQRAAIPDPPRAPERRRLTPEEAKDLERALARFEQAWFRADHNGYQEAAEDACRIDPTNAAARSARSRAWVQVGRNKEALAEATEAIRLDPNDAWAYSNRAAARIGMNEAASGIADATIGLRLDPANAVTWNNRSWCYLERGQYHQALADATEAIRLRPNFELPYANRGLSYVNLGEYKQALAEYTKALARRPTHARWWMVCSALRTRLGDSDGARKDREQAIAIDPKQPDAPGILLPPPPRIKTDPTAEP
jgi:tetratricopeptide (TPR) repeat protein